MLRLKIWLAKGPRSKDFWEACKDYSGMGTQRRKAAPPTEALAKYFTSSMSLPGEEGKEVPLLEQAPPGARRLQGFKVTRAKVSKVLQALVARMESAHVSSSTAPRSWTVRWPACFRKWKGRQISRIAGRWPG